MDKMIKQQPSKESLTAAVGHLKTKFASEGALLCAKKCEDLIGKLNQMEFTIACCGHFSAGKSTVINDLLFAELLPTNPIPTSANVVKIKKGPEYVKLGYLDGRDERLPFPKMLESIHSYCVDGDQLDYVEISHEDHRLPENVSILDTPGIDSNQDMHRVAAESRLHLADVVLYITDYNHVESSVNFEFIKNLNKQRKKVIMIVNQIDKHVEAELSFSDYKAKIEESIHAHHLQVEHLFFTTMKEPDAPFNEWDGVKRSLNNYIEQRNEIIIRTVLTEAYQMIKDFIAKKQAEQKKGNDHLIKALAPIGWNTERIEAAIEELRGEIKAVPEKIVQFEQQFFEQFELLLDFANLMPYHTREIGKEFLESRFKGFKVSRLFSRKNIKQEKQQRLQKFYEAVTDNVHMYIDIPLKTLLEQHFRKFNIYNDQWRKTIHSFSIDIDQELFIRCINRGALISSESVLHYCEKVKYEIQGFYKRSVISIIDEAKLQLEASVLDEQKKNKEELSSLERKLKISQRLDAIEMRRQHVMEELLEIITFTKIEAINQTEQIEPSSLFPLDKRMVQSNSKNVDIDAVSSKIVRSLPTVNQFYRREDQMKSLYKAADLLKGIHGFHHFSRGLRERLHLIERKQSTVALFGAFSAGKSSFANALLGENILPVSPNPTTSVINKILPPTDKHPHKTALAVFKSEKTLVTEINEVLTATDQKITKIGDIAELFNVHEKTTKQFQEEMKAFDEQTEKGKKTEIDDITRPILELLSEGQMAYLRAVINGYELVCEKLGKTELVDPATFKRYIKNETFAVFIDEVNLFYDCPLTSEGITLIDTPGVDSIHTRHTEIAFDYIAKADAILFVTYYNHSFTKGDRSFLNQLSRMSDYFSEDKLFFIVNAADLATTANELTGVIRYVDQSLSDSGIDGARIYPISSHRALSDRGRSGIHAFDADFSSFVLNYLRGIQLEKCFKELEAVYERLKSWHQLKNGKREERSKLYQSVKADQERCFTKVKAIDTEIEEKQLRQEIEELIYYVKQRVFYKFGDEYKQTFSPFTFQKSTDLYSNLLQGINDMVRYTSAELATEMRMTTLRIDQFLDQMIEEIYTRVEQVLKPMVESLSLTRYQRDEIIRPHFSEVEFPVRAHQFSSKIKHFKSEAHFFEDGHKQLRAEIEMALRDPVNQYGKEAVNVIKKVYVTAFSDVLECISRDIKTQLGEYFEGQLHALSETDHVDVTPVMDELYELLY